MRTTRWLSARLAPLTAATLLTGACTDREPVAPSAALAPPSFQASAAKRSEPGPRHVVTLAVAEGRDFEGEVKALGGQVERRHPEIGVVTVTGLSAAGAKTLAARADVAGVDLDVTLQWIPPPDVLFRNVANAAGQMVTPQGTDQSTAFFFPLQWNIQVIQAQAAWRATPAGKGQFVCVLDTGIDPDQIDLAGRIALDKSTSFVEAEPTIQDFNTHGTFVSSIITSNGRGVASVAPDGRLCAIKVLGTSGSGTFGDLIAGIVFAAKAGANVINMSLGAYVDRKEPGVRDLVNALQRAIDFANRRGVVVVAAAGNDAINLDRDPPSKLDIPSQLNHVISVGATAPFNQQHFDRLASYSNFGGNTGITLVAPGGDLLAGGDDLDLVLGACSHTQVTLPFTCTTSSFLLGAGTSFAAPHVAGASAVVASQPGGDTEPGDIGECLREGADRVGPAAIFGAGRLNVANAARCEEAGQHGQRGRRVAAR